MEKFRTTVVIASNVSISVIGLLIAVLLMLGGPDGKKSEFLMLFGLGVIVYTMGCLVLLYYAKKSAMWAIVLLCLMVPGLYWVSHLHTIFGVGWAIGMLGVLVLFLISRSAINAKNEDCLNNALHRIKR